MVLEVGVRPACAQLWGLAAYQPSVVLEGCWSRHSSHRVDSHVDSHGCVLSLDSSAPLGHTLHT